MAARARARFAVVSRERASNAMRKEHAAAMSPTSIALSALPETRKLLVAASAATAELHANAPSAALIPRL